MDKDVLTRGDGEDDVLDELEALVVGLSALVFREAAADVDALDLFLEEIFLVQKEDLVDRLEPGAGGDFPEDDEGFLEAVDGEIFSEHEVIVG